MHINIRAQSQGLMLGIPRHILGDGMFYKSDNMVLFQGELQFVPGYKTLYGTPLLGSLVMHIEEITRQNLNRQCVVITDSDFYASNDGFATVTRRTRAGGASPYTGSASTPWITDTGPYPSGTLTRFIFTNGVDNVQTYSVNIGVDAVDLTATGIAGSVIISKAIAMYQSSLFHLNTTEGGTKFAIRLRWSDSGLIEIYNAGVASFLTLYQGGFDEGINLVPLGPYLIAYRGNSIHVINLAGSPFFFSQRQVVTGKGLAAARAYVNLDTRHVFLGYENVYSFNGIEAIAIGDEIRDVLFNSIDIVNIGRSVMGWDRTKNILQLVVPSSGGDGTPDTWWLYNLTTGGWSGPIQDRFCTAIGTIHSQLPALTWATVATTWDKIAMTWKASSALSGGRVQLFGNADRVIYQIDPTTINANGASVTARWESKAVNPGEMMDPPCDDTVITEILPLGDETGIDLIDWYVGVSNIPTGTFTFFGPYRRGVRGVVNTQPIRGSWFVYAAQASTYFAISGVIATHLPGATGT